MEKNFFEAFPNLKLTGARKDLFEQVVVERITATRRKDILRIYIRSERLIEKEDVYGVEQEIKKQFFPKDNIIIKIYEKFILSGQYNPEKLMDTYKDSVLMELKDTEHMLYTMFRQADMEYPDEQTVKLILEDSVIAKSKEDELIRILDKVLNERCGFSVKFHVDYREAAESKYREEDELKIQQIVASRYRRQRQQRRSLHRQRIPRHLRNRHPLINLRSALKKVASSAVSRRNPIILMSFTAEISMKKP